MKYLFLLSLFSFGASAESFNFNACDNTYRINFSHSGELVTFDKLNALGGGWTFLKNENSDDMQSGKRTVDEFMDNFLIGVNEILKDECDTSEPIVIPDRWYDYLNYIIRYKLKYDSSTNKVTIV